MGRNRVISFPMYSTPRGSTSVYPTPPRTPSRVRLPKMTTRGNNASMDWQGIEDLINTFTPIAQRMREFGTQTDTETKRKKKSYTSLVGMSKSGGKVKTKKRYKKYAKSKRNRAQLKGHVYTLERNNTYSPAGPPVPQTLYVGHYTHPINRVRFELMRGIFKRLLAEAKIYVPATDSLLSDLGFSIGDSFNIDYENPPGTPFTVSRLVAAGDTFSSLVAYFGNNSRSYFTLTQTLLSSVYFDPSASSKIPRVNMDLKNCYVSIYCKSNFKIQNRTVQVAGQESSEEVDNMPVFGKGYMFKGNQTSSRGFGATLAQLSCNPDNGVFETAGGNGTTELPNEPPEPAYWTGVKKFGSIHLDPGVVKTSVISKRESHLVNWWIKQLQGGSGVLGTVGRQYFGVSKVFAIEKMINANGSQPISLATEHNLTLYVTVKVKKSVQMRPIFEA